MPWTSPPCPALPGEISSALPGPEPRQRIWGGARMGCDSLESEGGGTTHSLGRSPAQQPGEGGVSPQIPWCLWDIGLSSESKDAGGIRPSPYTWTRSKSFPSVAGSKPAPGDTGMHSWGRTDGIPGGTNAIPGTLRIPEGLIVSLGGTNAIPGGLSSPEGPVPSLGDQWHLGCSLPSEASLPHPSLPQAARDPRTLPGAGVQVALAEHWDCHPQRWPHKTHPSTRADGSQGRREAEGNYPSRDLHRPRRLEITIIWPGGLFWCGGGCPAPSRATPG